MVCNLFIKLHTYFSVSDNTTHEAFGVSVHVYGSANVTQCLEIINVFLKSADGNWCYQKPCAIGATYQPPVGDVDFYAISAFTYAPRHLDAVDDNGVLDVRLLMKNAASFCAKVNIRRSFNNDTCSFCFENVLGTIKFASYSGMRKDLRHSMVALKLYTNITLGEKRLLFVFFD